MPAYSSGVLVIIYINSPGYTALHTSVVWGQLECMKLLVTAGADYKLQTRHGETVRELACRYGNTECVAYIDNIGLLKIISSFSEPTRLSSTEARKELHQCISRAKEMLADTEKISGKWNKDDKVSEKEFPHTYTHI